MKQHEEGHRSRLILSPKIYTYIYVIHFNILIVKELLFVLIQCILLYVLRANHILFYLLYLLSSLLWLRSTPVPGDHGEGQVLAVLALDRGDKSLGTPEDSLPVGKLGTSLSRPCHTLPCRSSLIGPALWRRSLLLSPPAESQISRRFEDRRREEDRVLDT